MSPSKSTLTRLVSTVSNVSLTPTAAPAGNTSILRDPLVKSDASLAKSFNIVTSSAFAEITD